MDYNNQNINLDLNNIIKCPECNLIPLLNLQYKSNGDLEVNYKCSNRHQGLISLDDFSKKNKEKPLPRCEKCQSSQINRMNCFFVKNKLYCNSCILELNLNINNTITYQNFHFTCKKHFLLYTKYCKNCQINICQNCLKSHRYHKLVNLNEFSLTKKEENELKTKLELKLNKYIPNKSEKKSGELLGCEFISNLLLIYLKGEKRNYEIIKNLKNLKQIFNRSFRALRVASGEYPIYLSKLKDGNFGVSFAQSLNIYEAKNFKLQLHLQSKSDIYSFTQLADKSIALCCYDGSIIIIKLIIENKKFMYNYQYSLKKHMGKVYKIIELKKNFSLISISEDKETMIWIKENKENKFSFFKKIEYKNNCSIDNILNLNTKFVISSVSDKSIKFFAPEDFSFISRINIKYQSNGQQNLCLCKKNILIIGR